MRARFFGKVVVVSAGRRRLVLYPLSKLLSKVLLHVREQGPELWRKVSLARIALPDPRLPYSWGRVLSAVLHELDREVLLLGLHETADLGGKGGPNLPTSPLNFHASLLLGHWHEAPEASQY
jgi:hypothetical protein